MRRGRPHRAQARALANAPSRDGEDEGGFPSQDKTQLRTGT